MGEIVEFPSNGDACHGYLALPPAPGPGVVVIQEWWGLVDHIKDVCERFASEGYAAIAVDLYAGQTTTEPSEAQKLMMDLKLDKAAKDMKGAIEFLVNHDRVEPKKIGCVGFCMGGALSLELATIWPIDACVTFYGIPVQTQPDYSKIRGAVLGHFAEHDGWASPEAAKNLFDHLQELGKPAEYHVYPGTEHAFFNDTRSEVHNSDAAKVSWERTLEFYQQYLH